MLDTSIPMSFQSPTVDLGRLYQIRSALQSQGLQNKLTQLQMDQAAKDQAIKQDRQNKLMSILSGAYSPATEGTQDYVTAPQFRQEARPASFDYDNALMRLSQAGMFDEAKTLADLKDKTSPMATKYFGGQGQPVVLPSGERKTMVMTERGPQLLDYTIEMPETITGGFVRGRQGQIVGEAPMTAKERAEQSRQQTQTNIALAGLDLKKQEIEQEKARKAQEAAAKAQAVEQKKAQAFKSVDDLDQTLAAYKNALGSASRTDLLNPASDKAIELKSLATQLQMAYKNAADLGAITGPDWAIINRIIQTPSGAEAAYLGPGGLAKQIAQVEQLSKRQRGLLEKQYSGGSSSGGSAYQEYLDAYNRAKTPEQRAAITARARANGVVK